MNSNNGNTIYLSPLRQPPIVSSSNRPKNQQSQGNDIIFGGPGDDEIFGEELDDTLRGGRGFDTIDGGTGNDTCTGEVLSNCP